LVNSLKIYAFSAASLAVLHNIGAIIGSLAIFRSIDLQQQSRACQPNFCGCAAEREFAPTDFSPLLTAVRIPDLVFLLPPPFTLRWRGGDILEFWLFVPFEH
jgi:hypothetical protein